MPFLNRAMKFDFYTNTFLQQEISPAKLAIAAADRDLSWKELSAEVDHYCELFSELKIPKGHPVILHGHKEAGFMAAMLAAAKCRLPYVPLDTIIPPERVKKIIDVTGSQVFVEFSNDKYEVEIPVFIGPDLKIRKNKEPEFNTDNTFWFDQDPLFYIIFTSGSTGEPKGVQITHEAIRSYIDWMERDYGFNGDEVFVNQAPFSFDLSVYEVLFSMHLGGSIILNSNDISRSPSTFVKRVVKYNGTVWVSTPSFAYLFLLEPSFTGSILTSLHTFLFCGEELPNRTAKKLLDLFSSARVLNTYGPTEATVSTTFVNIDRKITELFPVLPVGFPKYTCEILILNEQNDPSLSGEIIIAGDNVSIGYLKNPELTTEKFYLHNGKRAYRTGDFGQMKDGMLFFSGRKDEQVKLNGYRIELGDINSQILLLDLVSDAVTVPLRSGAVVKKIVSFVTLKRKLNNIEAKNTILESLKRKLPEYMVPGDIRIIMEFPYSNNHKIDKKKLIDWYTNS